MEAFGATRLSASRGGQTFSDFWMKNATDVYNERIGGTVANLKTWRFADDVNGTFTVTYTYVIAGDETDSVTNPTVEMLPSLDVNITARPVKPTVNERRAFLPRTRCSTNRAACRPVPSNRAFPYLSRCSESLQAATRRPVLRLWQP